MGVRGRAGCHARAHDPNTQKKSLRGGQMKSCKRAGGPNGQNWAIF